MSAISPDTKVLSIPKYSYENRHPIHPLQFSIFFRRCVTGDSHNKLWLLIEILVVGRYHSLISYVFVNSKSICLFDISFVGWKLV